MPGLWGWGGRSKRRCVGQRQAFGPDAARVASSVTEDPRVGGSRTRGRGDRTYRRRDWWSRRTFGNGVTAGCVGASGDHERLSGLERFRARRGRGWWPSRTFGSGVAAKALTRRRPRRAFGPGGVGGRAAATTMARRSFGSGRSSETARRHATRRTFGFGRFRRVAMRKVVAHRSSDLALQPDAARCRKRPDEPSGSRGRGTHRGAAGGRLSLRARAVPDAALTRRVDSQNLRIRAAARRVEEVNVTDRAFGFGRTQKPPRRRTHRAGLRASPATGRDGRDGNRADLRVGTVTVATAEARGRGPICGSSRSRRRGGAGKPTSLRTPTRPGAADVQEANRPSGREATTHSGGA